jgi:hypothetical protein
MSPKRHVSTDEARTIGARLGVDWKRVDLGQFRRGLEVELEHGARLDAMEAAAPSSGCPVPE